MKSIMNDIYKIECDIQTKKQRIKKLERDYEELLSMKSGLNRALEKYQQVCDKKKKAFQNVALRNNRAMQKFCDGISDMMTDTRSSQKVTGISNEIEEITKEAKAILLKIQKEENDIQKLKKELDAQKIQQETMKGDTYA